MVKTATILMAFCCASPVAALEAELAPRLRAEVLEDAGGGGSLTPGPEVVVPIALTIIPGFGVGHYWIGDARAGFVFLIVDAVIILGGLVAAPLLGRIFWPVGGIIWGVLWIAAKVWEILDLMGVKVTDVTGWRPPPARAPAHAAAPPGADESRFRPAVAR
jgi:hypothetical protein